jgi:hypothetical protein
VVHALLTVVQDFKLYTVITRHKNYIRAIILCEKLLRGGGGMCIKGMWPQDSCGGSLLIFPNLYVMLAL